MKAHGIVVFPAMLVFCVGMALGQDAAHDVDKGVAKTGQVVKHVGKKVGHATKSSVKGTASGGKMVANDTAKGVKKASEKTGDGIKDATGKQTHSKPN